MMHSKAASLAIVIAVCLIHFSYVDFRYRHRGSVMWFWLAGPASTMLWVSRAAIVACLAVALGTLYFGVNVGEVAAMVALLVVHIATLIVVEVREDDWVPPGPPPEE
jgi:hypothetical protein